MRNTSDITLCQQTLAGNDDAFALLVERYSALVFTVITRITTDRQEAEELTQDVFLKVYSKLKSYKGDSRFSTWLYRIAYNTALSAYRKPRLETADIDDAAIANVSDKIVDEVFNQSDEELLSLLDRAIEQLSPDDRALIILFYMEEHSIEEVAFITGQSTGNIKTRLHRIRKKLYILITEAQEKL